MTGEAGCEGMAILECLMWEGTYNDEENKKTYGLLSLRTFFSCVYVPTTESVERISKTFSLSDLESSIQLWHLEYLYLIGG